MCFWCDKGISSLLPSLNLLKTEITLFPHLRVLGQDHTWELWVSTAGPLQESRAPFSHYVQVPVFRIIQCLCGQITSPLQSNQSRISGLTPYNFRLFSFTTKSRDHRPWNCRNIHRILQEWSCCSLDSLGLKLTPLGWGPSSETTLNDKENSVLALNVRGSWEWP